jgi:hypothetical protein
MDFLIAVVPTLGVTFLFVVGIRALIHADRRERIAQSRFDAERARFETDQSRFDADQSRFETDQSRFDADQSRFEAEQAPFEADRDAAGPENH